MAPRKLTASPFLILARKNLVRVEALLFFGGMCWTAAGCGGGGSAGVDTENPPEELKTSVRHFIEDGYCRGGSVSLAADVSVYTRFNPDSGHPRHRKGEYQINLYKSRWHARVYPFRRAQVDGKLYEIWMVHYGGQGPWYDRLKQHRYYVAVVANDKFAKREIIRKSDRVPGDDPDHLDQDPDAPIWTDSLDLPSGKVVDLELIPTNEELAGQRSSEPVSRPASTTAED